MQQQEVPLVYAQKFVSEERVNMNQPIIQPMNQQLPEQTTFSKDYLDQSENISLIFFILGFFNTICWLVGWIKYVKSPSAPARKYALFSKWFFIISTVLSILAVLGIVVFYLFVFGGVFLFNFRGSSHNSHY